MPARNVTRCRARSSSKLDLFDELNLVHWIPMIPGTEYKSFDAMRDAWNRHRDELLPHFTRQRPGTRPFAMWALGELPFPPLKHQPCQYATRVTIEGIVFYCPWHYFGTRTGPGGYYCAGAAWGELKYLRRLGIVDAREAALAEEWVDDRHYGASPGRRTYQPLAYLDRHASAEILPPQLERD